MTRMTPMSPEASLFISCLLVLAFVGLVSYMAHRIDKKERRRQREELRRHLNRAR